MRQTLKHHPDSRSSSPTKIEVDVARPHPGHLVLRYIVTGTIGDLCLPRITASARAHELWKHTCFEAFIRDSRQPWYYELNFAPSTQWAAYRFDGYRSGMSVASEVRAPRIEVQSTPERYELQAALEVPGLPSDADWRFALSAVIEETSGGKSYWALAHPPGQPDFHHSDCFALELAAA